MKKSQVVVLLSAVFFALSITSKVTARIQNADVLNAPIDINKDFQNYLVRNVSAIPHIKLAQSTKDMDWSKLTLKVYAAEGTNTATAKVFLPEGDGVKTISLSKKGTDFNINENPLNQKTSFKIEWIK